MGCFELHAISEKETNIIKINAAKIKLRDKVSTEDSIKAAARQVLDDLIQQKQQIVTMAYDKMGMKAPNVADMYKKAEKVNTSAEPVQKTAESEQVEPAQEAAAFIKQGDYWNYSGRRAKEIAKELGLTVSERDGVPMIGIPDHAKAAMAQELRNAGIDATFEPAQEVNTLDSGAELTANKRNRLTRGLKWEDVADKNDTLRVSEVTKAKVYPKPDYQDMVDNGINPLIAHIVKQAYDAISIKPQVRGTPTDENLKLYISAVNHHMDGVMAWANDSEQAATFLTKLANKASAYRGTDIISAMQEKANDSSKSLLDHVYPGDWHNFKDEIRILGGNKAYGALQPSTSDAVKARKDIEKGWPGKTEAWQKSYQVAQEGGKWFVAKVGRSSFAWRIVDKLKDGFDTQNEAIEAARSLVKREKNDNQIQEKGWSVASAEREGVARRMEGEDISSDKLKETFGFKGVNFGNWMKTNSKSMLAERQAHLNHAYDAFLDLAEIVGVPPKAMSLNGMLGIAIGAQGSGKALAHFVPGVNEINLTRTGGAGALAHEWAHALDHYFATLAGLGRNKDPYLTEHVSTPRREVVTENGRQVMREAPLAEGLRPEVFDQFNAVVKAMTRTMSVAPTNEEAQAAEKSRMDRAEKGVDSWLKSIRRNFESVATGINRPGIAAESNAGKAETELKNRILGEFDALANRIRAADVGDGMIAASSTKSIYPVITEMRFLYKKATGRAYSLDDAYNLHLNVASLKRLKDGEYTNEVYIPREISSQYQTASSAADKQTKRTYWATKLEMFARAFDAYVVDTLAEKAAKNTYLSGIEAVPPQGEERKVISRAFDFLLAELNTKETDQGTALFSQSTNPVTNPHTESTLTRAIDSSFGKGFTERLKGTGMFRFITSDRLDGELSGAKFSKASDAMRELASLAESETNENSTVDISPVAEWEITEAKENSGIDLSGYHHTADMYSVRHALNQHGDEKTEERRGQIAITEDDIAIIPLAIDSPDAVVYGAKNSRKQDQVASIKRLEDGTVLVIEEVRVGRETLALASIRKFPAAKDFNSIARTLLSNAQSDGRDAFIIKEHSWKKQEVRYSKSGRILAYVQNGITTMVIDNISQTTDNVKGLILHEIGSHAMQLGKTNAEFQKIIQQFNLMAKAGNKQALAAQARVPKDTNPAHVDEEGLSHYLESNPDLPFTKRIIAAFRDLIRKLGAKLPALERMKWVKWANELTTDDIVYIATQAVKGAPDTLGKTAAREVLFKSGDKQNQFDAQKVTDDDRVFARLNREEDGSLTNSDGVTLTPAGETSRGSKRYRVKFGNERGNVGSIIVTEKDGVIVELRNIEIDKDKRGKGIGSGIIKAIIASHDGIVDITDIVNGHDGQEDSRGFWKYMGTRWVNYSGDATQMDGKLSWRDYANATNERIVQARGRSGTGSNDRAISQGIGSESETESYGSEIPTTEGYEVGEVSDNDLEGIKFSRRDDAQNTAFNIPDETSSEKFRRHWQDAVNRWKTVQDAIKSQGGTVSVYEDVEAAMKRYPGRVGEIITQFTRDTVEPLLKRMASLKTDMEDIGTYLYALHAADRNAYVQTIRDDMPDSGSGMTNAQASKIIQEYQARSNFKEFNKLAHDFQALTGKKLDMLVNGGVITQDQRDAMDAAMGKNYVPLKGFEKIDEEGNRGNGSGIGFSTNRKLDRTAYGRVSKAGQIVENIIRDFERGILATEKANVGSYLKNLVEKNPDTTLWTVDRAPRQNVMGKNGVHTMPAQFDAENEVQYIENGKPIRIQLHDPLLARSYNNLGVEQMDAILKASASLNAVLRQMWTQKNPAFFLINPIRDIQTSLVMNTSSEGTGFAIKTLKQLPGALKAAWNWERNKQGDLPQEWQSVLKAYGDVGARTGAAFVDTLESKSLKLQELLSKHGGNSILNEWQNYGAKNAIKLAFYKTINNRVMDVIEHLNGGFENMTRLATFKQFIDDHGGMDAVNRLPAKERAEILAHAGKLAKNVTVNFNQRGEYGANANALYLFFNANVQGTANAVRALSTSKHKHQARAMMGGLIMLGMMLALATDDDDDELTPDHIKSRNLVFHINGQRYQLPMPYGFSWFVDLGRMMGDVSKGRKDIEKASIGLVSSLFANFSPLGDPIKEGKGTAADLELMFAPTVLKPGAMIGMNRGAFGNQLMPEGEWNKESPDRQKMWRNTRGSVYDMAANSPMLAWADVSPESLKTVFQYIVGGAGRFVADSAGTGKGMFDGKPFDIEKMPIVNKFVGINDVEEYRGRFYEQLAEADATMQKINQLKKTDPQAALKLRQENRDDVALSRRAQGLKKMMKALRDREDAARENGDWELVASIEQKQIDRAKMLNQQVTGRH